MNLLLVAPVFLGLGVAVLCLALRHHPGAQRGVSAAGAVAELAAGIALFREVVAGGPLSLQAGGWPFAVGITLVADLFSALMVLAAAVLGAAVVLYSLATVSPAREAYGYHTFVHVLLGAVAGAFLTGDLFNLYVWFEVMLVASFVLTVLRGEASSLEKGLRYMAMSLVGSTLFLAAAGTLYATVGSLNLADLSLRMAELDDGTAVAFAGLLLFLAFGIKAAAFPLFHWLPGAYSAPPPAVSALFAGLLTKVGVYALLRISSLLFGPLTLELQPWLLSVAGLTMLSGVLGALAQDDIRRLLAFHSISQIGYMLMGWALLTPLALAGAVFFLLHHLVVKANLFLIAGAVARTGGTFRLAALGGFRDGSPALAGMFGLTALSLAGIPPFSGFFAKLALLEAGIRGDHLFIAGTAIVVSFLTLVSMTKVWNQVFSKPDPNRPPDSSGGGSPELPLRRASALSVYLPIVTLAILAVVLGVATEPIMSLASRIAHQLLDPAIYVRAVSGG